MQELKYKNFEEPGLKNIEPARLDIYRVSVSYGTFNALDNITFSVNHGERVAVIGPNGAGKSTLFKTLIGLIRPAQGRILIHGQPLGHHFDCVAYIPQREDVDWMFPVTVKDVVGMGRYSKSRKIKRRPKQGDIIAVKKSMGHMDITSLADRPISDLSGGQQQRVFIARALAQEPHVFLMDEPFNGIDVITSDIIWALLDKLKQEKVTVLIATHDLNLAAQRFDSAILLNKKIISYGKPGKVFTKENLLEAYGQQILHIGNSIIADQCCPGKNNKL
ncbi:MAG: metal ABC transporter ATP-binding protein [Actinobacteria bacterium]|nr:metal ABC transporter ATP-binding protein [Actinomycetota bacterium]